MEEKVLTLKDENKKTLNILCGYNQLLVSKTVLPIFIYLKPDRQFLIKLEANKSKEEVNKLLKVIEQWFSNLKIQTIFFD